VEIGERAQLGVFEEAENKFKPNVYTGGLVTIGEYSQIPADVKIGKNVAIVGTTTVEDYPNGILASGESIIRQ
jgi:glucose-1-phosphate adenylyltransferase